MRTVDIVSWAAPMACLVLTVRAGSGLHEVRLFAATALLSVQWALLGIYYALHMEIPREDEASQLMELLPAVGSFLAVVAGGALRHEAASREAARSNPPRREPDVGLLDRASLWLLMLVVVPRGLKFPDGTTIFHEDFWTVIGLALTVLSFVSLIHGSWRLDTISSRGRWIWMLPIGVLYLATEGCFYLFANGMSDGLRLVFAGEKLALTLSYCFFVSAYRSGRRAQRIGSLRALARRMAGSFF